MLKINGCWMLDVVVHATLAKWGALLSISFVFNIYKHFGYNMIVV